MPLMSILRAIEFPLNLAQTFPEALLEWGVLGGLVVVALALVRVVERRIDRKNGNSWAQVVSANTEQVRELRQDIVGLSASINAMTTILALLQKDVDTNSGLIRELRRSA